MRTARALALAVGTLVALSIPAGAGGEERDRARQSYFIDVGGESNNTRTSLVISGRTVTTGYVLNDRYRCNGERGFYFIDFSRARIRDGRFSDVDKEKFFTDQARGKRAARGRITGRARGITTTRGPDCRYGTRFTLEKVDRAKWRRYSKKSRRFDRFIGAGTDS